ncbi:MAG: pyridoxamine 5-phosphate oxidase [Bacilli bacterium]|nr:pyridoxamine 5-phosphate oxidase [Bacilli bacterium]
MAETITALTEQLFMKLQKESFVLLSTVDAETGSPNTTAVSWLYAVEPDRLRFAIDQRSRIVANVQHNKLVNVTVILEGSVHAIYGSATIVSNALEGVPFKLTCIDIEISAVRDAMFYGSRISVAPEYEKTYDKRAAEKLDGQVFNAMRKA